MPQNIVETARIRLRPGASEAELIAASDRFQKAFLDAQPGFVRRELLRLDDREFLDLVHWRDRAAADAVMERAMDSEHCRAYFALMEMGTAEVGEGVRHYASLATYGSL
jgi:heme-degrading monooxygenase HmoA